MAGGANNALYRVTGDGQQIACKLCVPDDRQRAAREYGVMQLLRSAGADVAPEPLWLDESCTLAPFPVVMYRWLSGEPLPMDMTGAQWTAFAGTIQQIHALRQANCGDSGLPDAWFHWFDVEAYLAELEGHVAAVWSLVVGHLAGRRQPAGAPGSHRRNLQHLRLRASGVDLARDRVPLSLCRVDANRLNAIWGVDGRLRWVDWEYSGWGDPALTWPICAGMLPWKMSAPSNTTGCALPTSAHQVIRPSTHGWMPLTACWSAGGRCWSCGCCGARPTARTVCVSVRRRRTRSVLWARFIRFIERAELLLVLTCGSYVVILVYS